MTQPSPAFRDSLYSTDSTTTYASTLSSLTSSLGLTESPLPPAKKTMAVLEDVRDRSEDYRRQAMLRGSKSRGELKTGGGVTKRVQSIENLRRSEPPAQTSQAKKSGLGGDTRKETISQRPSSSQLRNRPSSSQLSSDTTQSRTPRQTQPVIERTQATATAAPPSKYQVAMPRRRPPPPAEATLRPPKSQHPPASPARSESTMAEDWEAELIRDAQKLQLRPPPTAVITRQPSREQVRPSGERDEWEMAAMMIDRRETGRDAEETMRRGAAREIAYPPAMPRLAIRAAPTGVTSIHVGVRPRIHPSRTEESLSQNQPDAHLPEPLFSPHPSQAPLASPSDAGSADGTVRGSYSTMYKSELAEKAKKEYEDWLAKKADREGGRDADGGYGVQEWVPRNRKQARFGELNQPVSIHPDPVEAAAKLGMGMGMAGYGQGQDGMAAYGQAYGYNGYPYPVQQSQGGQQAIGGPQYETQQTQQVAGDPVQQGHGEYDPNAYPYGYWDQMAYWWAMAQMGMLSMEDMQAMGMGAAMGMQGMTEGPSPITSEGSSTQGSSEDEQTPHIRFAKSPVKDKGRAKRQPSTTDIQQQALLQPQQQQQMLAYQQQLQQYGQEMYDPYHPLSALPYTFSSLSLGSFPLHLLVTPLAPPSPFPKTQDMRKMVHWGMTPPHHHADLPGGEMGMGAMGGMGMGAMGGMGMGGMGQMGMGGQGMGGMGGMGMYPQPNPHGRIDHGGVGFGLGGGQQGMGQMGQMPQMSMMGMPMGTRAGGMGMGGMGGIGQMGQMGGYGGMGMGGMGGMSMGGMPGMQGMGQMGMGGGMGAMLGMGMGGMGAQGMGMGMNPGMGGMMGQMGMQHGQIPNEGGYNPYMAAGMGQGMMGQSGFPQAPSGAPSMVSAQSQQMPMGSISGGADLKAFDAGKMKAGRLGHYGYLEGRELAGPPPGYLPAGVKPDQLPQSSQASAPPQSHGAGAYQQSHAASQYAPTQYQQSQAPSQYHRSPTRQKQQQSPTRRSHAQPHSHSPNPPRSPGSVAGSQALSLSQSAWGNPNDMPRARYDGASNAGRMIQADMDTPYPRLKSGGMSSGATRYDGRQEPINGNGYRDAFGYMEGGQASAIDGRLGRGHRRMREGRV